MLKKFFLLACVLSFGSAGPSRAHPLDSPDIVYIDGLPCNSACQSYMAWSRQTSSLSGQPTSAKLPQSSANPVVRRTIGAGNERSRRAARARIAKQAVPVPRVVPSAKIADLERTGDASAKSDSPSAKIADSPPIGGAVAVFHTRTIQEQVVAATALAEHVTAAAVVSALEKKSNDTDAAGRSETVQPGDAQRTSSLSKNNPDHLIALLMARSEINSVSDLTNKSIAIDDKQSASNDSVRTAIAAAGATAVQLSEGQDKAIDRLIRGEVPAAVVTLASPEAAEWFPDFAGFKIFRIPLSPFH